jgi:hypothetical protein
MTTTTENLAGSRPTPQSETTPNQIPYVPIHNFSWMDGMDEQHVDEAIEEAIADEITEQVKEVIQDKPITESDIKPTQQQINSGRFFWILAGIVAIAFGFSLFQQPKQTETLMESQQTQQEPQVQNAQLTPEQTQTEAAPKQVQSQPLPERDPTANVRNVTALEVLKNTNQVIEKATEARARFLYAQWQQLAVRNPQSYRAYLLAQLRRINTNASKLSLENKTSLIGSAEQLKIALDLSIDAEAIASELSCLYIAEGKMPAPETPLKCQNIAVNSPSIGIAQLIKSLNTLEIYEGILLKADTEEALSREEALQAQRLKANTQAKPKVGILNK